jgi:pSer/pThr/pTyr-binding forkhead associated (FHA) protein
VRDLGSKNGVFLNAEKINAERKLKNGDKLVVGPLEFYVHIALDNIASTDSLGGANISCHSQSDGDVDATEVTDTVLLDHLKSLSQETIIEPEQPVLNLLKKFL